MSKIEWLCDRLSCSDSRSAGLTVVAICDISFEGDWM